MGNSPRLGKSQGVKSFSDRIFHEPKRLIFRRGGSFLSSRKEVAQKLFDKTLVGFKDQNFGFVRVVKWAEDCQTAPKGPELN